MISQYIYAILLGYIIGALPLTFFLVKKLSGKDLSSTGSGNIGAMNSYEITGKRYIGILAFLIDATKGLTAVYLSSQVLHFQSMEIGLALSAAVLGHNASIFLRFKGGRGLAVAVGGSILINPLLILIWLLLYLAGYHFIHKNVHLANTFASLASPIIFYIAPNSFLRMFQTSHFITNNDMKTTAFIICLLIILAHIRPLHQYFKNSKQNKT